MVSKTKTLENYVIGSIQSLTAGQRSTICKLCERQPISSDTVLGGRNSVAGHHIDGLGPIVFKHYRRGGILRHLIRRWYVKHGTTRCEREFELLNRVIGLGINAPEPIAFVYRGTLFYRAWLLTRQIPQAISLARLAAQDIDLTQSVMTSVIKQISLLIQNNILHVDLHPGNVMV